MSGRDRFGWIGVVVGCLTLFCCRGFAADSLPTPRIMTAGDIVRAVALFDDAKRVAATGKNGSIHIWDITTGKELPTLNVHADEVHALVVSPDQAVMASTGYDASARLWDLKTLKLIRSFKLPWNGLQATFSPDGQSLLISMQTDMVQVIDIQTGAVKHQFRNVGYVGKFTPDGQKIVTATRGEVRCWTPDKESLWKTSGKGWHPSYLAFTPDSSLALVGMNEAGVLVLDMKDGHQVRWQNFHDEKPQGMAVDPKGRWALTGTAVGNIYQWEISTGAEITKYAGHTLGVRALDISRDGTMFVSGGEDGTVRTWRVGSPEGAKLEPGIATAIPPSPAAPPASMPSGGTSPPAGTPSSPAQGATALAQRNDPIERPEFRDRPKQIEKDLTSITSMMVRINDDGSAIGFASDIIATATGERSRAHDGSAHFLGSVGKEMRISEEEAIRAVTMRYPRWIGGDITFSFGEKYSEHDGGSAGTAFAVICLSALEGIELDPKCAITGDITVDWKVRKVGAVAAKLRGATVDGCLYAAIPQENATALADMYLLSGDSSLWDIQTLTISTLQDAVAIVRKDRAPALAEALRLFDQLRPALDKSGRAALRNPATASTLRHILELAPNHLSARLLLEIAENRAPTTLSAGASLYEISLICYPIRNILFGKERVNALTLPSSITTSLRRRIQKLRPVIQKDFLPALTDLAGFVERAEAVANRLGGEYEMYAKRDQFLGHLAALSEDRNMLEHLVREGY